MTLTEDEKEYIRLEYAAAEHDSKNPYAMVMFSGRKRMQLLESIFGKEMFTKI